MKNIKFTRDHLHVGLAPYIDTDGRKCASYQLLNDERKAIAILDLVDGQTARLASTEQADVALLVQFAKNHFKSTEAISFSKP